MAARPGSTRPLRRVVASALLQTWWPAHKASGHLCLNACETPGAAPCCILAWRLVNRDFGRGTIVWRVLRPVSFLQANRWRPAATTLEVARLWHI